MFVLACSVAVGCSEDPADGAGAGGAGAGGAGASGAGAAIGGASMAGSSAGTAGSATGGSSGNPGGAGAGGGVTAGTEAQAGHSGTPGVATCNPPNPTGMGLTLSCGATPSADGLCTLVDGVGRSWTYPPLCTYHAEAKPFCEGLVLDGHDDWHLPTIDELRTVVTGCPATAVGGACRVTSECTAVETCFTEADCNGCMAAGSTFCTDPQSNQTAMLSDTLSPTGSTVWVLSCLEGAMIARTATENSIGFQCVR